MHNFNYFMATVLYKFPIPFTLGLCLPSQCSLDDLNDFKPFMIDIVNTIIPNMFEEVKGFSKQTHIHEEDLLFVDSAQENRKTTGFKIG